VTAVSARTKPISRLRVPDPAEPLPAAVQRFFATCEKTGGFVPNYFRAHSLNGENLARLNGYMLPLLDGAQGYLPIRERELICLVVSAWNGCSYCQVFHMDSLGKVLDDKGMAQRICLNYKEEDLSARETAICDLAIKVTKDPHSVSDDDVEGLRTLGLDDHEILEAIEVAALINATNRVCISLGVPVDMEFFD
jgi:uncharacterized peroxidase-related enzyme